MTVVKMKKLFALCVVLAVVATGCVGRRGEYRRASGKTWGTLYNITYKSDRNLDDSIEAVMRLIDMSLSPFCKGSVVDRLNNGEDVEVDSMFVAVFTKSQQVSKLSGGLFDPTVAPLINLWGFGYREGVESPDSAAIAKALATVGIDSCRLEGSRVIKKHPSTEFNFSAIAKGYGCDCVAQMLRRNGCTDYLVEIGGEIALSGVNDRGEKWKVQVDAPVEGATHQRAAVAQLSDCGIASSGNYRNFRDTDKGRIGHTISPLTGRPIATSLLAVTIVAPTCMEADALATACMAMPVESARAMIEALPGVEALFIDAAGVQTTPGFPRIQ